MQTLIPDLLTAFDRLLQDAVETDPKCWGKEAIARTLVQLDHSESAIFLRGLRHVQREPTWEGQVDAAATLRGICTLALLQCMDLTREEKLWHGIRALTDATVSVRADAARALGELAGIEAALLLRLKAQMGDQEAIVTGQALESLLRVEREAAVPFVLEFLNTSDAEVCDEAVLALGASRLPDALRALIEIWNSPRGLLVGDVLLRAISASRQETALNFLIDLVRESRERDAMAALEALELHRESQEIRKRIAEAVQTRSERGLQEYFRHKFPAQ